MDPSKPYQPQPSQDEAPNQSQSQTNDYTEMESGQSYPSQPNPSYNDPGPDRPPDTSYDPYSHTPVSASAPPQTPSEPSQYQTQTTPSYTEDSRVIPQSPSSTDASNAPVDTDMRPAETNTESSSWQTPNNNAPPEQTASGNVNSYPAPPGAPQLPDSPNLGANYSPPQSYASTSFSEPAQTPTTELPTPTDPYAPPPQPTSVGPVPNSWQPPIAPVPLPSQSGRRKWLLSLIILAALIVAGAGAFAYVNRVLPNRPQNIIREAIVNGLSKETLKSYAFDSKVSFENHLNNRSSTANFEGVATNTGAFQVSGYLDATIAKITFDIRSPDGKDGYIKIGGLNGVSELLQAGGISGAEAYGPFLKGLNEQWYEINQSILHQITTNGLTFTENGGLNQSDAERVGDLYKKHPFVIVQQTYPEEKVKGVDSHHYKIVNDKTILVDFLRELRDAKIKSFPVTQANVDSLKAVQWSKYPIELWVAKDSRLINQVVFSTNPTKESSINVRVTMSDFNKSVKVEKPVGAKSIAELLSTIPGSNGTGDELTPLLNELAPTGTTF